MRALVPLLLLVALSGQAEVAGATSKLLEQGVLGAVTVIALAFAFMKDRALSAANERYVTVVMELTKVLARNNDVLHDVETSGRFPAARGPA